MGIPQPVKRHHTPPMSVQQQIQNQSRVIAAMGAINLFMNEVNQAREDMLATADKVAAAYEAAGIAHKNTCDAAAKAQALDDQIMFSIMTVAAAGPLAWVFGIAIPAAGKAIELAAVQRLGQQASAWEATLVQGYKQVFVSTEKGLAAVPVESMVHVFNRQAAATSAKWENMMLHCTTTVKDVVSGGINETLSAVGPLKWPSNTINAVDIAPLGFQQRLHEVVSKLLRQSHDIIQEYLQRIVDYTTAIAKNPKGPPFEFDAGGFAQRLKQWRTVTKLMTDANLPDPQTLAADLERAIWAAWILQTVQVGTLQVAPNPVVPTQVKTATNIHDMIQSRFRGLRIEADAGANPNAQRGYADVGGNYDYDAKLIAWAKQFKMLPWAARWAPDGVN